MGDRQASTPGMQEEVLRQSEERFRLLVQSVRDYAIFMLDPEGYVATWNEGAENIKGYAAHEIVGRHFSTFYPPEDLSWNKPAMELEVATAEGRFEDEGWRLRKDGTRFWANVVITALREEDGELVGFAKVTRDLTERRASEQRALEDARRIAEVEASSRAKSEFLAAVSHELRTPLNAIGGYVDLIAMGIRGPVTEQQAEDLERIRRSQQHLLGVINDLLNLSRVEAGGLEYSMAEISLAAALEHIQPMIELQAGEKGLELAWPGPGEDLLAHAEAPRVEQVLLNLLTNAVKFTEAGGAITVSFASEDGRALVHVRDTGVGIDDEQVERIFDPFVQVGRSLASQHEGAGLGLAISRELARGMGGDLTVVSRPGEGSTFTLALPCAEGGCGETVDTSEPPG